MSAIKRVGFFHFGGNIKSDPVGSLQHEIGKFAENELENSLIVLPEAFNAYGGLYQANPDLDPGAVSRLQALANGHKIVFVVGLIERIKGPNSAYLIDSNSAPVLLSRKQSAGWDCLYTACADAETAAVLCGDVAISALVCDDANYAVRNQEWRQRILRTIEHLNAERSVLCIPAYMTNTDSVAVARLWSNSVTVVLANGCKDYSSIILHGTCEQTSKQYADENEIKLCDLWYRVQRCPNGLEDADLERCVSIIRAGAAVDVDAAKLRRATTLVVAKRGDEIIGVGSVKRVRPDYALGIAADSGFSFAPETPELGYVAVDAAHRGNKLSRRIVGELLRDQNGALFATTDCDRMKRTLSAAGFVQQGREWKGNRGQLSLWLKT